MTAQANKIRKHVQSEQGFTLIDVAILMLVIGLLTVPFIQAYNANIKQRSITTTNGSFAQIRAAIESYYFENGYYPCPADPALGPNDNNFGAENRTDDGNPATMDDCVTGAVANLPNPGDTVMWGAVPHVALGLTVDQTLDFHRNKVIYSVSEEKTKDTTFNTPSVISINVTNDNANCSLPANPVTTNGVHLVLTSSGDDGAGGYTLAGQPLAACSIAGTPTLDSENCDRDNVFVSPICSRDTNAGATFYDDLIDTATWNTTPSKIWDTANNPDELGSSVGFVGIANRDPQYHVDVSGNIRTQDSATDPNKKGNAHAREFCAADGSACFDPDSIADYDSKMNCDDNEEGMTGIAKSEAGCIKVVPNATESECDDNEYAIGFTAGGTVICSAS